MGKQVSEGQKQRDFTLLFHLVCGVRCSTDILALLGTSHPARFPTPQFGVGLGITTGLIGKFPIRQTDPIPRGREARQSKRAILQRVAHPGLPLPPQFPEAEPVEDKSVERVEKTRRNARGRKPKSARGKSRFQGALICPFAGQNRRRRDGCEWSGQLSFAVPRLRSISLALRQ